MRILQKYIRKDVCALVRSRGSVQSKTFRSILLEGLRCSGYTIRESRQIADIVDDCLDDATMYAMASDSHRVVLTNIGRLASRGRKARTLIGFGQTEFDVKSGRTLTFKPVKRLRGQ